MRRGVQDNESVFEVSTMRPYGILKLFCPICGKAITYDGHCSSNGSRHHDDFGIVCSTACLEIAQLKYARMILGKDDPDDPQESAQKTS